MLLASCLLFLVSAGLWTTSMIRNWHWGEVLTLAISTNLCFVFVIAVAFR